MLDFFSVVENSRAARSLYLIYWGAYVDLTIGKAKEFLEFGRCTQVDSEAISNEILRIIKKADLVIMNCRGQGYDGTSNMSSETAINIILLGQGVSGQCRSKLRNIDWEIFWKTGALELAVKILEKHL